MADDAMLGGDADRLFPRDVDHLVADRLRIAFWLGLTCITLFALADLRLAPTVLLVRLYEVKTLGVIALAIGLLLLLREGTGVRPTTVGVAVCTVLCAVIVVSGLMRGTHEITELLLPVLCISAATLVPWGVRPQLVLVAVAFVGVVGSAHVLAIQPLTAYRTVVVLIALIASLSLAHAFTRHLEEQHHAERIRLERAREEHARRMLELDAQVTAALARVGREMISSLEERVLHERLCALSADTFACDTSCTVLVRPGGTLGVAASRGLAPAASEALRALDLRTAGMAPLLARLARDDVASGAAHELLPSELATRLGAAFVLCLALRRGGDMHGAQICGRSTQAGSFRAHDRRIATGVAQIASMALENARLVGELGRASRLKSEFVSTMSHELRTPLNVILGYVDMLADEEIDLAARREVHARAQSAGRQLLQLIEGTLDVSRIEAGRDRPRLESVPVRDLWRSLRESCAELPRAPAVALEWKDELPDVLVQTDPRKLRVIVHNLVANACKFTERGSVHASAWCDGDELRLEVADTGIGIPLEYRATVFDMFQQVDGTDTRRHGGSGLGLYIVRRFVEQLGGRVGLDSEPGLGSRLTVVLPLHHASVAGGALHAAGAARRVAASDAR